MESAAASKTAEQLSRFQRSRGAQRMAHAKAGLSGVKHVELTPKQMTARHPPVRTAPSCIPSPQILLQNIRTGSKAGRSEID